MTQRHFPLSIVVRYRLDSETYRDQQPLGPVLLKPEVFHPLFRQSNLPSFFHRRAWPHLEFSVAPQMRKAEGWVRQKSYRALDHRSSTQHERSRPVRLRLSSQH